MSDIAIKVENISKKYELGSIGTGTLYHSMWNFIDKIKGKQLAQDEGTFWALKDINFEVKQGDVVGIIGKNGAGKSTLLKVLSKITEPTTGRISINGRVASLLEVGTGFHPELTGRENIFLNGSILGMTKSEIIRKFDEIVEFSGVKKFIDTPVKRYSSGMYVRLAFAVAAHLEPEILIIDEVLAVGDAEFQKKCLGKMKDVAGQGRTVLFVSHNMDAVKNLCSKCIFIDKGQIRSCGDTNTIIKEYIDDKLNEIKHEKQWSLEDAPGNEHAKLISYKIHDGDGNLSVRIKENIFFDIDFWLGNQTSNRIDVSLHIFDGSNVLIGVIGTGVCEDYVAKEFYELGQHSVQLYLPNNQFNSGQYSATFRVVENQASRALVRIDEIINFKIESRMINGAHKNVAGYFLPTIKAKTV
ncbi:MAG: polysaccharide ABC transporter ATP-binding protein [Saprospiraceae bacterium]